MLMDPPIYDDLAKEFGAPDKTTPCTCNIDPDDCVLHPPVQFVPASDAVWQGDDEHPAAVGHA